MSKKLRQALTTTPRQLMDKAIELLEDTQGDSNIKCLIVITNKTGQTDDWEIER
jgi:hypothetical protein